MRLANMGRDIEGGRGVSQEQNGNIPTAFGLGISGLFRDSRCRYKQFVAVSFLNAAVVMERVQKLSLEISREIGRGL